MNTRKRDRPKKNQPTRRWNTLHDGEWFYMPTTFSMRLGCCDCGLVHRLMGRVLKDGRVQLVAERDDVESEKVRRRFPTRFEKR